MISSPDLRSNLSLASETMIGTRTTPPCARVTSTVTPASLIPPRSNFSVISSSLPRDCSILIVQNRTNLIGNGYISYRFLPTTPLLVSTEQSTKPNYNLALIRETSLYQIRPNYSIYNGSLYILSPRTIFSKQLLTANFNAHLPAHLSFAQLLSSSSSFLYIHVEAYQLHQRRKKRSEESMKLNSRKTERDQKRDFKMRNSDC